MFILVNETLKVEHPLFVVIQTSKIKRGDWWIFPHNEKDQVSSYEWNNFHFEPGFEYTLSYKVKTFRLLPSPFPTDCIDYREETDSKSHKDCIRKCKVRQALSKCGGLYRNMDVFEGEPNVTFVSKRRKNCVWNLKLNEICLSECPRYDCFKQHIELFCLNEKSFDEPQIYNKFKLLTPFEPKTVYEHRPSFETIEFLCHWASTISLWFGLSVISVVFRMKSITINIYQNIKIKCNAPSHHLTLNVLPRSD